mgnify:CR=1 FL=1
MQEKSNGSRINITAIIYITNVKLFIQIQIVSLITGEYYNEGRKRLCLIFLKRLELI